MATSSTGPCTEDDDVVNRCTVLVLDRKLQDVIDFISRPDNACVVKRKCWALVKAVMSAFSTISAAQRSSHDFILLEAILNGLTEAGSAKEMVYALFEQVEELPSSDSAFPTVLRALARTLACLPLKQRMDMEVVREALYSRMAAVELPEEYALQQLQDDGDLAPCEEAAELAAPLLRLVTDLMDFVEVLLPGVGRLQQDPPDDECGRRELSLLLVKLLDYPLVRLRCEGTADACCDRIIGILSVLQPDFSRYWEDLTIVATRQADGYAADAAAELDDDISREQRKRSVERLSLRSVGNFAYLVLVRGHSGRSFPAVFDKQYVLELVLKPACALLESSDAVEMEKGLLLLETLLGNVVVLPELFLEHDGFSELLKATAHYATMSSVSSFRRRFQHLLLSLVGKFSPRGRFALLLRLLRMTESSNMSVNAYVTTLLKEQVHAHRDTGDEHFDGRRLDVLLDAVFRLPGGDTTDLVERYDPISAGLNLAVYLLLQRRRRRRSEQPSVDRAMARLKESFLLPLDKCLTMSKRQYSDKLAALRGGKELPPTVPEGMQVSVGAEKLALPALTAETQIKFLEGALLRMGLLEMTLTRALELVG